MKHFYYRLYFRIHFVTIALKVFVFLAVIQQVCFGDLEQGQLYSKFPMTMYVNVCFGFDTFIDLQGYLSTGFIYY